MQVGALEVFLYLGLPLWLGSGMLAMLGIGPRQDRLSYLGWAWMAGSLGTGAILGAWLCSSPASLQPALPACLMAGFGGLFWFASSPARHRTRDLLPVEPDSETPKWETWFFRLALGFVLFVTLERILFGSLHAVVTTDEAAFWSFRAKVLFHEGGFGQAYAEGVRQSGQSNADYPLLNPLLQLWAFVVSGQITHLANRFIILLFCPALVLVLAGAMRRCTRPLVAGLLLLLLANMQPFLFATAVGYSDVMVALGALVVLDAALRWSRDGRPAWLALGGLGLAFAVASKNDGVLVVLALAAALLTACLLSSQRKERLRQLAFGLPFGLPALAVYLLGKLHNSTFQFNNTFFEGGRPGETIAENTSTFANILQGLQERFFERSGPIAKYFGEEVFFAWQHSTLLLVAFTLLATLFLIRGRHTILRFAANFVGILLLGLMLVFVSLPFDLDYHLRTAAARVSIDVLPIAMLWLAAFAGLQLGLAPSADKARVAPMLWARLFMGYLLLAALASSAAAGLRLAEHGAGSFDLGLHWSSERRMQNALGREDARYGLEPGTTAAVHGALLKHVPEEGEIVVNLPRDGRTKLAFSMRILTYPRRFRMVRLPADGQLEESDLAPLVGNVWILDLIGLEAQLEPYFGRVEAGQGWSLWR